MNKLMTAALILLLASPALAEDKKPEAKPEAEKLVCAKSVTIEKVLNDKGYVHLLDMTTENIVQSLWIAGKSIIATAQVPSQKDASCLLATFTDVTLNPTTITSIYEVLQKTQKGI